VKQKTELSFTDYLNKLRIHMAIKLLMDKEKTYTMKEISDMVGYNSQHYFSRAFKNYTGVSPNQYRNEKNINL
jgi:two-component system response regulator YesN